MDSSLSPRDIQSRIRAGESVESVARAAGVPTERIEAFAGPVLAERDHVAGLAQQSPVRRSGESESKRLLRLCAAERFKEAHVDAAGVDWDAHLLGARRWHVEATYERDGDRRTATFVYDQAGRFSTPSNDEGRWLAGEELPQPEPEPTPEPVLDEHPAVPETADEADAETDDAYAEGELREVNGVYEIVPADDETDAVLDMLSGYDEDSVRIYSGLVHPQPASPSMWAEPGEPDAEAPFDLDETPEPGRSAPSPVATSASPATEAPEDDAPATTPSEAAVPPVTSTPATKRRTRPAVPSWDEIMFGAPKRGDERS